MAAGLLDAEGGATSLLVLCGIVESAGIVVAIVGAATDEGPRLLRVNTASRVTISPGAAGAPGVSLRLSF
jgi:hypothetical protein